MDPGFPPGMGAAGADLISSLATVQFVEVHVP